MTETITKLEEKIEELKKDLESQTATFYKLQANINVLNGAIGAYSDSVAALKVQSMSETTQSE